MEPLQLSAQLLIVKLNSVLSTLCGPMSTRTLGACLKHRTRSLHASLFIARVHSSFHELAVGASISRLPSVGDLKSSKTACFNFRSGPILRICPNHCSRLARIHATRLNVRHFSDASWCAVLPVMMLSICELAPFRVLLASACSCHASDPYVSTLQTQDL